MVRKVETEGFPVFATGVAEADHTPARPAARTRLQPLDFAQIDREVRDAAGSARPRSAGRRTRPLCRMAAHQPVAAGCSSRCAEWRRRPAGPRRDGLRRPWSRPTAVGLPSSARALAIAAGGPRHTADPGARQRPTERSIVTLGTDQPGIRRLSGRSPDCWDPGHRSAPPRAGQQIDPAEFGPQPEHDTSLPPELVRSRPGPPRSAPCTLVSTRRWLTVRWGRPSKASRLGCARRSTWRTSPRRPGTWARACSASSGR